MGDSASDQPPSRRGRPRSAGSSVLTPPTGMPQVENAGPPAAAHRAEPPLVPPVHDTVVEPCVCGHSKEAHDHYRPGTDCGTCGAATCDGYRMQGGSVRRTLRRLGLLG